MTQHQQSSNPSPIQEEEISLIDILLFLKQSWKTIAISGIVGFVVVSIYLLLTPKRYQVVAPIQMAQVSPAVSKYNKTNLLGINIEEPALLIKRMSFPSSYTPSTITACGLDGKENAANILAKLAKFKQPNGLPNLVELNITASDSERALQCTNAIFDLIKMSQNKLLKPYIEEAKYKLAYNENRLAKVSNFILQADQSGSAIGAAYLSTRDEIRYLLDEIEILKSILASDVNRATQLVAPIYIVDVSISSKKQALYFAGLLGGLFLGLLIALGRLLILKIKSQYFNMVST